MVSNTCSGSILGPLSKLDSFLEKLGISIMIGIVTINGCYIQTAPPPTSNILRVHTDLLNILLHLQFLFSWLISFLLFVSFFSRYGHHGHMKDGDKNDDDDDFGKDSGEDSDSELDIENTSNISDSDNKDHLREQRDQAGSSSGSIIGGGGSGKDDRHHLQQSSSPGFIGSGGGAFASAAGLSHLAGLGKLPGAGGGLVGHPGAAAAAAAAAAAGLAGLPGVGSASTATNLWLNTDHSLQALLVPFAANPNLQYSHSRFLSMSE